MVFLPDQPRFPLTTGRALPRLGGPAARLGALAVLLAANAALATVVASGKTRIVVLAAAAPLLASLVLDVIVARRELLVYAAFILPTIGSQFDVPLVGGNGGGGTIYVEDVIVGLAIVGYVVARLVGRNQQGQRLPRTAVLSWPFALFTVAVLIGVVRGHERYGFSLLSQPTRMIVYAGIATALTGVSARVLYRAIVAIFYVDAVWQVPQGLYHLATGTSQTSSVDLSTGGTRALALSTAMYLAGALVLALLNLEFDQGRRRALHLVIAGCATFGIVIALGRTTFGALAVLVPLLFIGFRRLRWTALSWVPLAIPVVALAVAMTLQVRPSLASTFADRLTGQVSADVSLRTRERKFHAALSGLGANPIFGLGFGRPVEYTAIDGTTQSFSGDPENSYVWILAGGGYFALGSLLLLIVTFFVDGIRRALRATGEARALIVFGLSLAFIFLFNTLTGPILSNAPFMLTIWIAMLLPAVASRSAVSPEPSPEPVLAGRRL